MNSLRLAAAPFLAVALVLAVACGGDSKENNSPALESSLDLSALVSNLQAIESFRFDMRMKLDFDMPAGATGEDAMAAMFLALLGNIELDGAYVAPDRVAVNASFFGMKLQSVQIGNESWTNDGSGWVHDDSGGFSTPFDMTLPSEGLFDFLPDGVLEVARTSRESVNGVEATRYGFDKHSLEALAAGAGDSLGLEDLDEVNALTLDIWLTDDGLPVKMQFVAEGENEEGKLSIDVEFNFSDFNDPAIRIERPI